MNSQESNINRSTQIYSICMVVITETVVHLSLQDKAKTTSQVAEKDLKQLINNRNQLTENFCTVDKT